MSKSNFFTITILSLHCICSESKNCFMNFTLRNKLNPIKTDFRKLGENNYRWLIVYFLSFKFRTHFWILFSRSKHEEKWNNIHIYTKLKQSVKLLSMSFFLCSAIKTSIDMISHTYLLRWPCQKFKTRPFQSPFLENLSFIEKQR